MNKNTLVIDTETIGLDKPFIYDIGGTISDEQGKTIDSFNFCISQIYNNKPLMSTAYYSTKRPIYTRAMKGKTMKKINWGNAMKIIQKKIKKYNIDRIYAFNSSFDKSAIERTQKILNTSAKVQPFKNAIWLDIRKILAPLYAQPDYLKFCIDHKRLTPTGRPNTTVETIVSYINNAEYVEKHTALADSSDERDILFHFQRQWGIDMTTEHKIYCQPIVNQVMKINANNKDYEFIYKTKRLKNDILYLKL